MAEALQADTELTFPHLTVVSASAGSGKTTALTKRYVQFLLSDRVQFRRPQHLLAITFTNNAAAEMKQRILTMLKRLSLGDASAIAEMSGLLTVDASRIPARAERVLEDILQEYAVFQVRTIDSFLATVFRSTAIDLGFSPSVELQLHPERLIRQSFRTFALQVAQEEHDMELFRMLVDRADEGRPDRSRYLWDPYSRVADRVVDLYHQVASLGRTVLLPETAREREQLTAQIHETARALRSRVETSGLPPYRFLMNDLDAIDGGDIRAVCERTPKKKATNKPKTKAEKEAEAAHADGINGLLERLNDQLGSYALLDARSYYVPYAQTLRMLESILTQTKRRENIIFLDDVNASLRSYLVESIVPEMYIKLGERIHHFLIDEFQDTSPSQWEALYPLLENSLAEHGSLFVVGDMKQSIYSFRGADWRIMRNLMQQQLFPSAPASLRTLDTNYRSKPALLEATREAFHEKTAGTDFQEAADATGLSSYSLGPAPGAEGGHVEIEHFSRENADGDEFDRITGLLLDARERGNAWGDIAVLAPTNAAVIELSSRLNSADIPFVSQSSLDIRNRKVIGELLSFLRFLDAPVDDAAFASFALGEILRTAEPSLAGTDVRTCFLRGAEQGDASPLYKLFQDAFPDIWERRFASLFQHVGFLPLYDLVSAIIGTFDVVRSFPLEQASVIRFLECVREFEALGNNAVRDFVKESAEESEGLSWELARPSGKDAVTLMTIHKAKGLGFHVVVALQYEWRNRGGRPAFMEVEGGVELVRVGSGHERNETLRRIREQALLDYRADELNKLYVALTRARSEMYVIIVGDDPEKPPAVLLPPRPAAGHRPRSGRPPAASVPAIEATFVTRGDVRTEPQESVLKDREIRRGDLAHAILAQIGITNDPSEQIAAAMEAAALQAPDAEAAPMDHS